MKHLSLLILVPIVACMPADRTLGYSVELVETWRAGGLDSPESVLLDPDTGLIFVSNVNGEAADFDANGYISRITMDGEVETRIWAEGLNGPKGMALSGPCLYVTDITDLVCINRTTGEIMNRWPAPGAGFLNDAAADENGRVFVTDSATARIYVLEDQMLHVWVEDERLSAVNGLLIEAERILATTMQGRFVSIDRRNQSIEVIGEGLGNGDMLSPDGEGGYFASEWPGQLYHLRPDGQFTVLIDARDIPRYMNDGQLMGQLLVVPHWQPGEVSAFEVVVSR